MATLTELRADLQRMLIDVGATPRYLGTSDLDRLINQAQDQFVLDTEALERTIGLVLTAGVGYVTPPADFIRPRFMIYKDLWTERPIDIIEYGEKWGFQAAFTGIPVKYALFEALIRLWPAPSESSPSTTLNDPGGISTSDAEAILTSGASFPTSGVVVFEPGVANEEVAEYFTKSTDGNTIKNLRRPRPLAHVDATAVKWPTLRMAYYARPKKLTLTTDTSEIPDRYTHIMIDYACFLAFRSMLDLQSSEFALASYKREIDQVKIVALQKQRQQPGRVLSIDRYARLYV